MWLGEVPEHWAVLPNRVIFTEVKERDCPEADMLSVTIKRGVIRQQSLLDNSSKKDSSKLDKSAYKLVRPGDIAYNKMRAWQGAIGVSEYDGIVSPAYVVQRPFEGAYPRYQHYLLRTPAFAKEAERWSYGITSDMWSLRPEHFKLIYGCLPPIAEQTAIARYLDHVDRRVQRLVRAKRNLIALLNEQKQAIIHRAVTRGLDPNVPLKNSGIEWVGVVPKHWDVLTLRRVILSAIDGPHHSPSYVDDGIPFLSARNIKTDEWRLSDAKYISEADYMEFSKRVVPKFGDVLYTKGGTTGVARAVDLDFRFQVWVHVAVLKVRKHKILPEYLAMTLNSPRCYEQSQLFTRGATNQDLGLNRMKGIFLGLPPIDEQAEILAFLERELRSNRDVVHSAIREIDLLNEYRTRLIADVVTGKLDVREAAAALPLDIVENLEDVLDTDTEIETDDAELTEEIDE